MASSSTCTGDLAKKLGREHSFVWRIETGERRLDVIEFHWVCQALGQDTPTVYRNIIKSLDTQDKPDTSTPLPKAAESEVTYQITKRSK